jgi:hypothetical protein
MLALRLAIDYRDHTANTAYTAVIRVYRGSPRICIDTCIEQNVYYERAVSGSGNTWNAVTFRGLHAVLPRFCLRPVYITGQMPSVLVVPSFIALFLCRRGGAASFIRAAILGKGNQRRA